MKDIKDVTENKNNKADNGHGLQQSAVVLPFQLPPLTTRRWVARRKAEVVAAVHAGMLSALEACRRYRLSPEEFLEWERHYLAGDLGWPRPAERTLN
jgi:hypothetical protein